MPRKAASPNVHLLGRWTRLNPKGLFGLVLLNENPTTSVSPQLLRTTTTKLRLLLMALKKLHWIFFRVSEAENSDSKPMKFQVVYSTTHFPSAIQLSEGNSDLPQIRGGQNKHLAFLSFWVLEKAFLQSGPPPLFFRVGFVSWFPGPILYLGAWAPAKWRCRASCNSACSDLDLQRIVGSPREAGRSSTPWDPNRFWYIIPTWMADSYGKSILYSRQTYQCQG